MGSVIYIELMSGWNVPSKSISKIRDILLPVDSAPSMEPLCICRPNESHTSGIPKDSQLEIRFVYGIGHRDTGSVALRYYQVARHLRFLFPNMSIQGISTAAIYQLPVTENGIVILTKQAIHSISKHSLRRLEERGYTVVADLVDGGLPRLDSDRIFGYISSSICEFSSLKNLPKPAWLIPHSIDSRLSKAHVENTDFAIAYFGHPTRALFNAQIRSIVDMHETPMTYHRGQKVPPWSIALSEYSMHYLVAPRIIDGFKPFTKGILAAAVGATVLIGSWDQEAISYLGADYPFQIEIESYSSVVSGLYRATRAVGSKEWVQALERMNKIREFACPYSHALLWAETLSRIVCEHRHEI